MLKKKPLKDDKEKLFLTHLDKIYWPKEKYTKADLLHYYKQIAPLILPYLKDRPIVLYRFPNGILHGKHYKDKQDYLYLIFLLANLSIFYNDELRI
jgi:bifunctional non-homologous end joining protein LigD